MREHIRYSADMVLVSMGKQVRAYALLVMREISDVGNNQVNAQHIRPGKDRTAIHNDDIVSILKRRHILADFANTTQRNNSQLRHFSRPPFFQKIKWVAQIQSVCKNTFIRLVFCRTFVPTV